MSVAQFPCISFVGQFNTGLSSFILPAYRRLKILQRDYVTIICYTRKGRTWLNCKAACKDGSRKRGRTIYLFCWTLEEANENVLHDSPLLIPVGKLLISCCPRNSRGSEKIGAAGTLATVHDFSRYFQRHLYHPCNELGRCRKASWGTSEGTARTTNAMTGF
jgi:hypothetical protein